MAEGDPPKIFLPNLPAAVTVVRCETGEAVEARLVDLTAKLAKTKIGGAWWVGLSVSKTRSREEGDHHWDWAAEVGKHQNKLYVESVAIQTTDDAVQGAAVYLLNGRSVLVDGAGAILPHWLATAPRNRPWLVPRPEYRGVGTNLIRWAAYHSYHLGFGGRIVLATLPSERTVAFYESLGFRATSAEEDDMVVYELEPMQARALFSRR
jgi:GNAT superfamily N-acetyltransferase